MKESQNQTNQFKDSGDLRVEIFNRYCEIHDGKTNVSEFKAYLDRLVKTDVKPLCK